MSHSPAQLVLPPVTIVVKYHPTTGGLELAAGEATADQVLVALQKAIHVILLANVRPLTKAGP